MIYIIVGLICQVEGCDVRLDGMKEYHQRYKICMEHLKKDYVVRSNIKMRFCQQCGRFEPLEEFDGDKRSCRSRLERHNRRRRKKSKQNDSGQGVEPQLDVDDDYYMGKQTGATEVYSEALGYATACTVLMGGDSGLMPDMPKLHEEGEAMNAASLAGLAFSNGAIQARPLVPSEDLMQFFLKNFARVFHYEIEGSVPLRPLHEPVRPLDMTHGMHLDAGSIHLSSPAFPLAGDVDARFDDTGRPSNDTNNDIR